MNQIEHKLIHLPPDKRLRQEYGKVRELAVSLSKRGQLQPVVIRKPVDGEEIPEGKRFILLDGGRRFLAVALCYKSGQIVRGVEEGKIKVVMDDEVDEKDRDPLFLLEKEFHANEDRKDFNWKEKADYVRRIHEGFKARDPEWSPQDTAAALEMGETTTYQYLELTAHGELTQDERVANADSFRTAYKQLKIVKSIKDREKIVALREQQLEEKSKEKVTGAPHKEYPEGDEPSADLVMSYHDFAQQLCKVGDCQEAIRDLPDESLDFVHWDPPYGGEQAGGAFSLYKGIDDQLHNAFDLLNNMVPEIWRVLRPYRWMALWYHPALYHAVVRAVQGSHDEERYRFWVNPYPNIWYKIDRRADGHEIRRFLVNAYETFLWCCKVPVKGKRGKADEDVILTKNKRQNVFVFKQVPKGDRRHIMHKPPELISEVVGCISVVGEIGCDFSYGSGSSIEAGFLSRRKLFGYEIDPEFQLTAAEAVEKAAESHGAIPYELNLT